ncbi:MAG: hypothetical protein ABJC04_03465 [Verrucomicrobiota bacterium]
MRMVRFLTVFFLAAVCGNTQAAEPALKKVLPHFIDAKGRNSVSPSLYERDAYQFYLRNNPEKRAGIRFDVEWRGTSKGRKLKLRVEMRGVKSDAIHTETLETIVEKKGWFSTWSSVVLRDDAYKTFGELAAWHATLWDGDQQLSELKSFLW